MRSGSFVGTDRVAYLRFRRGPHVVQLDAFHGRHKRVFDLSGREFLRADDASQEPEVGCLGKAAQAGAAVVPDRDPVPARDAHFAVFGFRRLPEVVLATGSLVDDGHVRVRLCLRLGAYRDSHFHPGQARIAVFPAFDVDQRIGAVRPVDGSAAVVVPGEVASFIRLEQPVVSADVFDDHFGFRREDWAGGDLEVERGFGPVGVPACRGPFADAEGAEFRRAAADGGHDLRF